MARANANVEKIVNVVKENEDDEDNDADDSSDNDDAAEASVAKANTDMLNLLKNILVMKITTLLEFV